MNSLHKINPHYLLGKLNNITPIKTSFINLCAESIQMYIKHFLILYADDTALMAESSDGLQKTLNCFEKYCDLWKLTVNTTKTKVVIFLYEESQSNSKL